MINKLPSVRIRLVLALLILLFGLSALPVAAQPLVLDATGEVTDSPGGYYAIELSLDAFASDPFYSTARAGLRLSVPVWSLPPALSGRLPQGQPVWWRAVSRRGDGSLLDTGAADSFIAGGAPQPGARMVATVASDFSTAAALASLAPADAIVPEEFLVKAPQGMAEEVAATLATRGFVAERRDFSDGTAIMRFLAAPGADAAQTVQDARADWASAIVTSSSTEVQTTGNEVLIQPNFVYTSQLAPTDPFYAGSPRFQYAPQMVNAEEAWTAGVTGAGILVAVIDTGLNNGGSIHQEFNGAGKVVLGPDFVNLDADPTDDNNHGTNVAGIAVAEADAVGMVGIAPEATLMPIKALNAAGSGSTISIASAVDHAVTSGARVINMSLGSNVFGQLPSTIGYDLLFDTAIRNAEARGVVVVAAAGNDRSSLPARPAGYGDTIYVGAIRSNNELTQFSNYGPWLTLVAPGYFMRSADRTGTTAYSYQSGTSQATPVVAGAVALILSAHPALTPTQVKSLLQESSADLGPAGRDDFFGHGRLDIAAALGLAAGADTTLPEIVRIEMTPNTFVATFSHDMLADGSANAVNNTANWLASSPLSTFLFTPAGRTISYNAPNRQLTVTHSSVVLSGANLFIADFNVVNTAGFPMFCNRSTTGQEGSQRQNDVSLSEVDVSVAQSYAACTAYSDGSMQLRYRYPMVAGTVTNAANYTVTSSPTNTAGTAPPGGLAVSLAGASLSYDAPSHTVTITNLPAPLTTAGTTFAVVMGAGIQQADLSNGIDTSVLRPIFGVVTTPSTTPPALAAVSNIVEGLSLPEVVRLTFNKPMRADSALVNPANYAVTVNSVLLPVPADLEIIHQATRHEVLLAGYDLLFSSGLPISVTVSNLRDVDGNLVTGAAATAGGTVSTANFGLEYRSVVATTREVVVRFSFWTKVNATAVVNPANWTLVSDVGPVPVTNIPLGGATFTYDSARNILRISGLTLTAGHRFDLTAGAGIVKRYPGFNPMSAPVMSSALLGGNAGIVVGPGDFSPVTPTSVTILKVNPLASDNLITSENESNLTIEVDLPAGTVAGQEVAVTLFDSSVPRQLISATGTAAGPGTHTFTGIDATAFALGPVRVQAMMATPSAPDAYSDIISQSASKIDTPLFVDLVSFTADTAGVGQPIVIQWETAVEVDNAGFHIYNAVRDGEDWVLGTRLTESLIPPASLEGEGALYEVTDPLGLATVGEVRAYFLADVDLSGVVSYHGPAVVTVDGEDRTDVMNWPLY